MPRLTQKLPSRRLNDPSSGQAVVTFDGADHYFGSYRAKASEEAYDRFIAECLANNRRLPTSDPARSTVAELIAAYSRSPLSGFRDNAGLKRWLADTVFGLTYDRNAAAR